MFPKDLSDFFILVSAGIATLILKRRLRVR
jgi:hypothetical protein